MRRSGTGWSFRDWLFSEKRTAFVAGELELWDKAEIPTR